MTQKSRLLSTANATKLTSTYFGMGDDKIEFESYQYQFSGTTITETVTKNSCVPIGYRIKLPNGFMDLSLIGLQNGIKDMSVFDIPKECKNA